MIQPLCVLVLEDDVLLQNAIRRILSRRGHQTAFASTLEECRRKLASPFSETRELPDVLLLDQHLPDGIGWSLKDEAPKTVRVVLMTGNPPPDAPPHWTKPGTTEELYRWVEGRM